MLKLKTWKKINYENLIHKTSTVAILYKMEIHYRDKENNFIMIKESIYQQVVKILNVYVLNN